MENATAKRTTIRFPQIATLTIGQCYVRVTLDTRHAKRTKHPVCVSFYFKDIKRTLYHSLPFKLSQHDYLEVCRAIGKGKNVYADNSPYSIKKQLLQTFDEMMTRLRTFSKHHALTMESVQLFLGTKAEDAVYFVDFWQQFNETKPVGTKNAYEGARKSFVKIVGRVNRTFITAEDIQKWEKGLAAAGLSKTTIGMYERSCRSAWNAAVRKGLASYDDKPFGKIPQGSDRKRDWLSVEKMTELYDIFINHKYPEDWRENHTHFIHEAVGLFLFQYLANGVNMADVARLTYNDDFFQSGGKILTFIRQKTEERSNSEVVIPLIEPLLCIMKELSGEDHEAGAPVFPNILKGETDPIIISKLVAQANKNVREGVRYLTDYLGWSVKPSGTWSRHSYATNLAHAGVPDRYISEAMGHTISGATTLRYVDRYPLEQQIAYNSKLLSGHNQDVPQTETVTLTKEEYLQLMKAAGYR